LTGGGSLGPLVVEDPLSLKFTEPRLCRLMMSGIGRFGVSNG
jgi:hypothetical protein